MSCLPCQLVHIDLSRAGMLRNPALPLSDMFNRITQTIISSYDLERKILQGKVEMPHGRVHRLGRHEGWCLGT